MLVIGWKSFDEKATEKQLKPQTPGSTLCYVFTLKTYLCIATLSVPAVHVEGKLVVCL